MGDTGEDFQAYNKIKKQKKKDNLEQSTKILINNNIEFISLNNGIHLKVTGIKGLIDFWPSTGKFIAQDNSFEGRGVFDLLHKCTHLTHLNKESINERRQAFNANPEDDCYYLQDLI